MFEVKLPCGSSSFWGRRGLFSYALILIPAPLRDWVYNWVAGHRYQWFGRLDSCLVPDPGVADRFLDDLESQRPGD